MTAGIIISSMLRYHIKYSIIEDILFVLVVVLLLALILTPIAFLLWLWLKKWTEYLGSMKAAIKRLFINIGILAGYVGTMYLIIAIILRIKVDTVDWWVFFVIPLLLTGILFTNWKSGKVGVFKRGERLGRKSKK